MPKEKDLFILTADSQLQRTLRTLLEFRRPSLGIRDISFEILRHPNKDPGCRTESTAYLREIQREYSKAMVVFDYRGCGAATTEPEDLERQLETELASAGWGETDAAVVVINPELEVWLFGGSFQRLQQAISWSDSLTLRNWFERRGHLKPGAPKPAFPQPALDALLSEVRRPRSSALFEEIARRQGLSNCQDRAFQKFRETLRSWFPAR